MAAFLGQPAAVDYDIVRDYWRQRGGWGQDFEKWWCQALNDGVIENTATSETNGNTGTPAPSPTMPVPPPASKAQGYEVVFQPDPTLWDGQFANNAWLQELPKPFSKVTWGNPAIISPRAAKELQLQNGEVIRIRHQDLQLEIPVWIQPVRLSAPLPCILEMVATAPAGSSSLRRLTCITRCMAGITSFA
jgi:molybdopterin-containing oxidoreductase family iron-sulfur binding subunit